MYLLRDVGRIDERPHRELCLPEQGIFRVARIRREERGVVGRDLCGGQDDPRVVGVHVRVLGRHAPDLPDRHEDVSLVLARFATTDEVRALEKRSKPGLIACGLCRLCRVFSVLELPGAPDGEGPRYPLLPPLGLLFREIT